MAEENFQIQEKKQYSKIPYEVKTIFNTEKRRIDKFGARRKLSRFLGVQSP
mgnify:CR=1 FL=1